MKIGEECYYHGFKYYIVSINNNTLSLEHNGVVIHIPKNRDGIVIPEI